MQESHAGKGIARLVRELISGYLKRGRDVTIDNPIIPAPGLPVKRQGAILENCHGFVPFALISKPPPAARALYSRVNSWAPPSFRPTIEVRLWGIILSKSVI